jgi:hypothetical protein
MESIMKLPFVLPGIFMGLVLLPLGSQAQSYWVLKYNGVATSTNGAGKMQTRPMTDRTLVQDCARHAGRTDTSGLALVLHVNGSSAGDTLEVVNTTDPNLFRCEVLELAFPQSYTNSAGTLIKTFAYIYNSGSDIFGNPSSHSRGSAVVTRNLTGNSTTHTAITGKLQFWLGEWIENAPAPQATICSGTFTSTGALSVP